MPKALSNNPSAVRARQYRANKAVKQGKVAEEAPSLYASPDSPVAPIEPDGLQVDVAENTAPKLSLKDRIFGVSVANPPKAKTAKKGQRGKQIDASLMSKVLPTMISGSIAIYARKLVKDPYKPCAPTQQEVLGTIGPLFSILARRIEIVGTASEDVIDLITALLTGLVTGIRIHITYLTIQEDIERAKHNDGHHGTASNAPRRDSGFYAVGNNARTETTVNPSREAVVPIGLSTASITDATNGDANTADGDSVDAKREAAAVASLFKRDIDGRARLGLLARPV